MSMLVSSKNSYALWLSFRAREIATALLAILLIAPRAVAMILPSYDVDSLVYMSTYVVAGKVTDVADERASSIEVKVESSYVGDIKPGKRITVAATDFFRTGDFGRSHLQVGDQLFLFLVVAKKQFLFDPPTGAYMPVPSGIKLIIDGKVRGFFQYNNPGPYWLETWGTRNDKVLPTSKSYPKTIAQAKRRVDKWRAKFAKTAKPSDTIWLLQLLREREATSLARCYDAIAEAAADRLANLHDPAAACEALTMQRPLRAIYRAFGTPEGREFLIRSVADPKLPKSTRARLAQAFGESGEIYRSILTNITSDSWKTEGEPDAGNSQYLTRFANVARDTVGEEEIFIAIVNGFDFYASWTKVSGKLQVEEDLQQAAHVLFKLLKTAPTESEKLAVERALREIGGESPDVVTSPKAPILCLIRRSSRQKRATFYERVFEFEFDYCSYLAAGFKPPVVQTILEAVDTGQKTVLPAKQGISYSPGTIGSGSDSVTIPDEISAGTYRIYYRFLIGDEVIATSHGITVKLPEDLEGTS